ncbi:MAG TPA: phospholipase D-like domain-containing protein [Anaerolineae bacterium]|nr:phospholipase D-like domain-containing protein [Anaerolineae bacterium]HQI83369.1 phospholipase D-like domain-containing protein [Anaerolineae bacterium]
MNQEIDTVPSHWFDKGVALKVVQHYFRRGKNIIRIAVGFFTVRGYNLIRTSARGKKLFILVGVNEPGEDRVKRVIIKEIMEDLNSGVDEDRRAAVQELVDKMEGGDFRIVDAHAMDHHAKLYLIDNDIALVGSANISGRGLIEAIEAGCMVDTPQYVADYVKWYEDYFYSPQCFDITQALIDALRRWLGLATPWDIYLKTLNALRYLEDTHLQRATYRRPVGFQTDVIARALRQIEDYRGAMVVASTGLGKTVIATDIALRLKEVGEILNVLVIGPKAVAKNWQMHLLPTGLHTVYFNPSALDATDVKQNRHWEELQDIFKVVDEQWLLIIDESHEFRKYHQETWQGGQTKRVVRTAFTRLLPVIKNSKAKVLLLTGTPLSTGIDNVNSRTMAH